MKLRRKNIYEVWLSVNGSLETETQVRFIQLNLEGPKTPEAAGRKAQYIAWKKMGAILSDIHVDHVNPKTIWY